jgi:hypothetical protein
LSSALAYATTERESFNHASDPDELQNAYPEPPALKHIRFEDARTAAKACNGADACAKLRASAP